jgi:hypothetical protein
MAKSPLATSRHKKNGGQILQKWHKVPILGDAICILFHAALYVCPVAAKRGNGLFLSRTI